jgi:hypothetical protein
MSDASPYQTPLPQGPDYIPLALMGDPPEVKVLAILHLVFAGFAIAGAGLGIIGHVFGNPLMKLFPHAPGMEAQMEAQAALQEKMAPATYTTMILGVIVAIPMIIAGIQMLRKRRSGLKWSNRYGWCSLGDKVVRLYLTAVITVPAMNEMVKPVMPKGPTPVPIEKIMSVVMVGSAYFGVVIACVYPLVTLILLNRRSTKEWFASLPE